MTAGPKVSLVIPLFNEEESVRPLYDAIVGAMDPLAVRYEMLFVDDGSRDRTVEVASELAEHDPRLRVVIFRRNYGQTPAMAAGIHEARGDVIVTMDGDLQNDPTDIGTFLAAIDSGYDIVVGWRFNRQDKLISRKIPSRVANWLIGKVTGVPIRDNGCSLKAYRASVIKRVPLYSEMHRFIPAMASIAGARIKEVKVKHHARRFGESKYGLSRVFRVASDLLTVKTLISFTARPLLWFTLIGTVPTLAGAAALTFALYQSLTDSGQPMIVMTGIGLLLLTFGGFFVMAGMLGELIHRSGSLDLSRMPLLTAAVEVREAIK